MSEGKSRASRYLMLMILSPPSFREMRETFFNDPSAVVKMVEQVALPKQCRRRIRSGKLAVEEQVSLMIVLLNSVSRQKLSDERHH